MAIRMQRGEGSITTDRRTGRKRVRVMLDGKRITLPGSFENDKQALGAVSEFWRLRAAASPVQLAGLMTVADWGVAYLNSREVDGVHRAVDRDRARWSARIATSSVGRAFIDTLTARDVRAWVSEQIRTPTARGKPPAKQTVLNALNLLRVALEEAVQAGHIESNPARDVRVPRMPRETEGWDWLRASDLERLFACKALTVEQRRIFTTAIFTGLRKGELWGLRWQDVDFDRGELVVSKSYSGPTKGGIVRRVPMLAPALEAIRAMPRRCSLVFPTHDVRMRNRNDSAGWDDTCTAAGIRIVRFHDMRHTCASHLIQGTWAPQFSDRALRLEEVQRWLGHKSIRTTERYAHLCDDAIRGRVKRSARASSPEGERTGREWTQVDPNPGGDAVQLAKTVHDLEARTRFELVCDGFANRHPNEEIRVVGTIGGQMAATSDPREAIANALRAYGRGERPSDIEVVRALAAALSVLPSAGRDEEGQAVG